MITVANIRTTKDGEYIGRAMPRQGLKASPLGNQFKLGRGMDRNVVIQLYRYWLLDGLRMDTPERHEIERLTEIARTGDLVLLCWCSPLSCHGDVIKQIIEQRLADHPA